MSNIFKDKRVKYVSIKELLDGFLEEPYKWSPMFKPDIFLWNENVTPEKFSIYYKLTSQQLIYIIYGCEYIDFGRQTKPRVEIIKVANRDGKTEYETINEKLKEIKEFKDNKKDKEKYDEQNKLLEKIKRLLPKYKNNINKKINPKTFNLFLKDTKYKTNIESLKNKYLVFDCETNGLGKARDDLLSLSIYDPTTGICYNRFFPLDLQPLILTGHINGISDKTLFNATHMTQKEFNQINDYFHLKKRILLSFSGGEGLFDIEFVQNYFKRHNINGFNNLKFENIKKKIPKMRHEYEGFFSKDNLCKQLGIKGVKKVHSSYNDCILQWKLFERLNQNSFFFHDDKIYECTPTYIIPYTYLSKNPQLIKYRNIKIPVIKGKVNELYNMSFPRKILKNIRMFQSNIIGVALEHRINCFFNAEEQNNSNFFKMNLQNRKCLGSLNNKKKDIIYEKKSNGAIKAIDKKDNDIVKQINLVTKTIIEQSEAILTYCKSKIFKNGDIISQELVLSEDKKVFTLCDLSDNKSVVEIKTCKIFDDKNKLKDCIKKQLYFQARKRKTYILYFKFDVNKEERIKDLTVILYKVKLFKL